jgi:hypothetical protein
MKTFKCIADVERFRNHPAYASLHDTVESLVTPVIAEYPEYHPEDDGYLVLIEPADVDRVLSDLDMPYRLAEVPFEGVTVVDRCFHAVYLANNQFALGFLIPDADWLPGKVRRVLEAHLDP